MAEIDFAGEALVLCEDFFGKHEDEPIRLPSCLSCARAESALRSIAQRVQESLNQRDSGWSIDKTLAHALDYENKIRADERAKVLAVNEDDQSAVFELLLGCGMAHTHCDCFRDPGKTLMELRAHARCDERRKWAERMENFHAKQCLDSDCPDCTSWAKSLRENS